ncbi:MAG: DEAD/DEAH box helicase [bacterium]|nr:DEAD/DEAH box helicase [bacterium]
MTAVNSDTLDRAASPAGVLDGFHPAVRAWFCRRFAGGPTAAQVGAWPAVRAGADTLVSAPTGSGKTLSAFLVAIDALWRAHERGEQVAGRAQVVYVSPLKALATDIAENLTGPIAEIERIGRDMGFEPPPLRVAVRSGDTTASARASMLRNPPNFVITTPESLYLLLTAARSREMLRSARWVIVDEIHAVARDKRGAHLALSLERLEHVCEQRPLRIGLSATQRPISTIQRLLLGTGAATGSPPPVVVDVGHRRELDLALELPPSELEAVAPAEQTAEILDRIAELIEEHRTTLVFVNTRREAERIAHLLAERLGDSAVASHHGSLSKERRLRVETRLRAGDLRALVATASLELGIDIGPVDLACQIGSPRSMATFLQRVGRSGHSVGAVPKGRLFPTTRDQLIECAALLAGVRAGRLDAVTPPAAPLDVLAQQITAECAAERWKVDDLFGLVRRAAPYADLSREDFEETLRFTNAGVVTGRGRRGDYVHLDSVAGEAAGRRGARLAALTSGGAIPDVADYRVLLDPDDTFLGTVNEDWAIESMAGDVFLLGSHSWRIRRVESGVVRVVDAEGAPPTVPFWLGEAPSRTTELSTEVSDLRTLVEGFLAAGDPDGARDAVAERCGLDDVAAETVVSYLAAARASLGSLPTQSRLVIERFFDETGGMQLVIHSPHGGRLNRGLGLALRKRFCRTFDFELQAAANDDAVVLSLGPQHSFPLDDVPRMLDPATVTDVLTQAIIVSPLFGVRWRWNLNRALTVLRFKGGKRNPPPIQRMEADDVMAAVFPGLAACGDNNPGPIPIPDHLLVRQTLHDALHEAADIDGLVALLDAMRSGEVTVEFRDTPEPSPLAHEILNGRPFTFLDEAPLEERRTRAVRLPRGLPVDLGEIGALHPDAIARTCAEVAPDVRDPDELHDLLTQLVLCRPRPDWEDLFRRLAEAGRAGLAGGYWCTTELRPAVAALLGADMPSGNGTDEPTDIGDPADVAIEAIRGHLEVMGPVTAAELAAATSLGLGDVRIALGALQAEGFALSGRFRPQGPEPAEVAEDEWCSRRLLARIHVYSQRRRRRDIQPVTAQDFMRFLFRWQHVAPGTQVRGRAGLGAVIEQLQGFEAAAGTWERQILARRIDGYLPVWLDDLCLSGELAWGRLGLRRGDEGRPGAATSRATPVTLGLRGDFDWLTAAARGAEVPTAPAAGALAEILESLERHGPRFANELTADCGRLLTDIESGLTDGVARGLLTADSFGALRSLLGGPRRGSPGARLQPRRGLRRGAQGLAGPVGRWSRLAAPEDRFDPDELAEATAEQLLARWGVVFRDLRAAETLALPWREVLWALRRLEARGVVRGGRFVTGFTGEQFALPAAVDELRRVRRSERTGERVEIPATDPLNLTGIVTPGPRIPAVATRTVTYVDGLPLPALDAPTPRAPAGEHTERPVRASLP